MFYAAFIIGLVSSLHCLGMCGPLAFALPVRTTNKWNKLFKYLLYNFGRILTYALFGLVSGLIGKGFAVVGLQKVLSVSSGILIIMTIIFIYNPIKIDLFSQLTNSINQKVKAGFQKYFQNSSFTSLFILGVLNGLLPCGVVYITLLSAIATGDSISGAIYMMLFGLGTMPMMLAVGLTGNVLREKLKPVFFKIIPLIGCIVGAMLIMRGLNTTISPKGAVRSCCHSQTCH
ncbi:sulfite exporter TauE/SafE family protein [Sporocytophaga myxococcoides]|uniref:sulfite exporter TauE/SafE family protein n=1 Tax=Sporocytophaga myxococcoides TaxID=153721 RepID=UPI000418224C|nr:sulfite exporter TauE/SafE family protein [Sporocytophaga myxococcoides]